MQFNVDQAVALLKKALGSGATSGDLLFVEGDSFSAQVRMGEIEKISSAHEKILGLRLFYGVRSALTSTSDLRPDSLNRLMAETLALAKMAAEDPCSGLPEFQHCATAFPKLDIVDSDIEEISIAEKIDFAKRAEAAALSCDPRLTNSDGADFGNYRSMVLYAASNGFDGGFEGSGVSVSAVPIATLNGQMQRDYWYCSRRKFKALASPASIGQKAAMRTLRRLGAKKVATCQVPVIFDPEVASSLLGHLSSALSGYALYKKASYLVDRIGSRIAPTGVTILEDPTLVSGLGSRPFDGEGLPSCRKVIVENGILKSYLLDTYSARKLGLTSTGNATRGAGDPPSVGTTNFYMAPGPDSPEEIIRSVRTGFYVTELIGFGVNTVTGDYSRGAVGLWIENGEFTHPVEEVTIAGNLMEMFLNLEKIGNDLDLQKRTSAPTLKISQMTVAGN